MKHNAPPGTRRKGILLASGALGLSTALLGTVAVSAATIPAADDGQEARHTKATTVASSAVSAREPNDLLVEDFEHEMATTPKLVYSYTGTEGETYAGDPLWIDAARCNGIVISSNSASLAGCDSGSNGYLKKMANALGQITGTDPVTNHVVSAYTAGGDPGADKIQLESVKPFQLGQTGRFVSFGVSAAAMNCYTNHPLLDFSLVDGEVEHKIADTPIDPCTDPGTKTYTVEGSSITGGKFVSKGGLLFTGDSLRWIMRNKQGLGAGNDGAIDHVSIVDSTPTLTQELTGTPIVADTARLTYRVVNTTEHGAKEGWSFGATLPDGLTVASDPELQTTCTTPDVSAAAGATSVTATGGVAAGDADCTISMDVTTTTPGTYSVDTANVTATDGLDVAGTSSVEFAPERNALTVSGAPVITGGNGDSVADLGEQIAFRYRVTNAGNVAVHDVDLDGDGACDVAELAVDASTDCTTTARVVTQDDVDAGTIDDQIEVSALSRLDVAVAGSATATVSTTEQSAGSGLAIAPVVKTESDPGVGGEVSLGVTVSNTGNVTLKDTEVVITGDTGMTVECPEGGLKPGESIECDVTGAYTVTQADVDQGSIAFSATATSIGPKGQESTATATTTQATVAQAPAVKAAFSGELSGKDTPQAGDTVSFEGSVENSGNVTLHDLAVALPGFDMQADIPSGVLAPGATAQVTVTDYTLTQADIDAGAITVPLHSSAVGPKEQPVGDDTQSTVEIEQHTAMSAEFSATLDAPGVPKAGDTVSLAGALRNTGNVTLDELQASIVDRDGVSVDVPTEAIAPGVVVPVTIGSYVLDQDDIDDGVLSFTLRGAADGPRGQVANSEAGTSIDLEQAAGAGLSLAPVVTTKADPGVGEDVSLRITASNTGNVTLKDTEIVIAGERGMTVDCPATVAPGKSVECTVEGSHRVTQADVDRGSVAFTATATSTAPKGVEVEVRATTTQATVAQAPAMHATFAGSLDGTGTPKAGDTVSFTGSVENTGNVTLRDVTIVLPGFDMEVSVPSAPLAPGETAKTTVADYTLTQADVDAGAVTVPMQSRATAPKGQEVGADVQTRIEIEQHAAMSADFSATLDGSELPAAGDTVTLTGTLRNTGNVTLDELTASLPGTDSVTVEVPAGGLAPETDAEATIGDYTLTQADIDSGSVRFSFEVAAVGPTGQSASAERSAAVELEQQALVEAVLSAHLAETEHGDAPRVGDEVVLSATVRNTGNVTLAEVAAGTATGESTTVGDGTLTPGADVDVALAPHVLTQQDIDRGSVGFDLTAAGASPTGDSVSSGDHRDVSLRSSAGVDIDGDYTASGTTGALRPGDVVTGTFRIANTGNRTLDHAEVEQRIGDAVSCTTEALQPGQVVDCESKYTVTEADAASGSLTFTATAKARYLAAEIPADGVSARAASVQKPVWVFSKQITKKFVAEPAPQELAFTGTSVVMVGVPVAIVVLLLGFVLLLAARRRQAERGRSQD